jgi:septal ring factor EnvC (AmiA/AmiB activator)
MHPGPPPDGGGYILAILFAIGTIVVSQFVLRPQIQHIIETRDFNKKNWDIQLARANKLDRELKDTQAKLADTSRRLEETQNTLASTSQKLKAETERANGLRKQLDETTARANRAEADLAAWRALGIPVESVKA